jgi:Holliday junction resolvase RusA-like endonuclease
MNEPGLKLDLTLPGVPPSVNKAYVNMARGRTLSKVGRLYHIGVTDAVTLYVLQAAHPPMDPDQPHMLWVRVHLPIYTKPGGEAKSRYKKLDASNRIKLLEDAVCHALGIDDSCFEVVLVQKVHTTPEEERTEVKILNLQEVGTDRVGRLFAESLQPNGAATALPQLRNPVPHVMDKKPADTRSGGRGTR